MAEPRIAAVVFDMDGVLVDTEPIWDSVRRELVAAEGGEWSERASTEMLGMSGPEWSGYVRQELGVPLAAREIWRRVVQGVLARLREEVPLIEGASEAVQRLAARWRLGLASSADPPVIAAVLEAGGMAELFRATVSSGEVGHGKPAPDVYLAAAERLGVEPAAAVAIEDSSNGMRAAHAAGLGLIAIPNASTAVEPDALALAQVVLDRIDQLTPETVEATWCE
jgi:HAD superfamily hydrolase (TIGR01509 family)